jgi:hypothetical protein
MIPQSRSLAANGERERATVFTFFASIGRQNQTGALPAGTGLSPDGRKQYTAPPLLPYGEPHRLLSFTSLQSSLGNS